jgi:predicted outer membrane protein
MRRIVEFLIMCAATALATGAPLAAEAPSTAEVLSKLRDTNAKEVDMGRMAAAHGTAREVRKFGKTIVKDHLALQRKVDKLAKDEKIELVETTAPSDAETLPSGPELDGAFTRMMLEDHRRAITELEATRDATTDDKLKKLLDEALPVMHRHEDAARELVDKANRS